MAKKWVTEDELNYMKMGGKVVYAQEGMTAQGDQQQQIMQLIQMYAQKAGISPEEIVAQLQQMQPEQAQQALQQMVQELQSGEEGQEQGQSVGEEQAEMQGGQEEMIQQIAQALQQGADPQELMGALVQQGIPEEQAGQLIQGIAQQMQGESTMAKGGMISPEKARKILHDGTVHGKPLTEKQRKFFGAMASRKAEEGTLVNSLPPSLLAPIEKTKERKNRGTTYEENSPRPFFVRQAGGTVDLYNVNYQNAVQKMIQGGYMAEGGEAKPYFYNMTIPGPEVMGPGNPIFGKGLVFAKDGKTVKPYFYSMDIPGPEIMGPGNPIFGKGLVYAEHGKYVKPQFYDMTVGGPEVVGPGNPIFGVYAKDGVKVISYKIQKGDNLSKIAKKYNTTVNQLVTLNNIEDPNKIYIGKTLNVPDSNSYRFSPEEMKKQLASIDKYSKKSEPTYYGGELPELVVTAPRIEKKTTVPFKGQSTVNYVVTDEPLRPRVTTSISTTKKPVSVQQPKKVVPTAKTSTVQKKAPATNKGIISQIYKNVSNVFKDLTTSKENENKIKPKVSKPINDTPEGRIERMIENEFKAGKDRVYIDDKGTKKVYYANKDDWDGTLKSTIQYPVLMGKNDDPNYWKVFTEQKSLRDFKFQDRYTPITKSSIQFKSNLYGHPGIFKKDASLITTVPALHTTYLLEPSEKRPERLKSPTPIDNAISYGCTNGDWECIKKMMSTMDPATDSLITSDSRLPVEENERRWVENLAIIKQARKKPKAKDGFTAESTGVNKPLYDPFTIDAKNTTAEARKWLTDWYTERAKNPKHKEASTEFLNNLQNTSVVVEPLSKIQEYLPGSLAYTSGLKGASHFPYDADRALAIHELTHGSNIAHNYSYPYELTGRWSEHLNPNLIKKNVISEEDFGGTDKRYGYEYFTKPTEVYARLNVLRNSLGLNPNKTYNPEDFKSIVDIFSKNSDYGKINETLKKQGYKNISKEAIRQMKDLIYVVGNNPSKLVNLLNSLAYTQPSGAEAINYTEMGGQIREPYFYNMNVEGPEVIGPGNPIFGTYAIGGTIPEGYHVMPSGKLMSNAEHKPIGKVGKKDNFTKGMLSIQGGQGAKLAKYGLNGMLSDGLTTPHNHYAKDGTYVIYRPKWGASPYPTNRADYLAAFAQDGLNASYYGQYSQQKNTQPDYLNILNLLGGSTEKQTPLWKNQMVDQSGNLTMLNPAQMKQMSQTQKRPFTPIGAPGTAGDKLSKIGDLISSFSPEGIMKGFGGGDRDVMGGVSGGARATGVKKYGGKLYAAWGITGNRTIDPNDPRYIQINEENQLDPTKPLPGMTGNFNQLQSPNQNYDPLAMSTGANSPQIQSDNRWGIPQNRYANWSINNAVNNTNAYQRVTVPGPNPSFVADPNAPDATGLGIPPSGPIYANETEAQKANTLNVVGPEKNAGFKQSGNIMSGVSQIGSAFTKTAAAVSNPEKKAGSFFQGAETARGISDKLTKPLEMAGPAGQIAKMAIGAASWLTGGLLNMRKLEIQKEEEKKQRKAADYRQAIQANVIANQGDYMSKYGNNVKNHKQRIIDEIYNDFDKYMKLT